MTGGTDGPGDLDARAASTWVAATGLRWALAPLALAVLVVLDVTVGHLAAGVAAVVLVLGLVVVPCVSVQLLGSAPRTRR